MDGTAAFRQRLAERGLRLTPQRLVIYETLRSAGSHPTAEELLAAVQERFPCVSPATIYNTLDLLVEMGLAAALPTAQGVRRFDGDVTPHAHAICTRCGCIADLPLPGLGEAAAEAARRTGFVLTGQRLEFHGLCPACAAVRTPEAPLQGSDADNLNR